MNDSAERDLRSRFAELRDAVAGDVPDFRTLLGRANRRPADIALGGYRWPPRVVIPIALAAAGVLAIGVVRITRRRALMETPLSTWTSPTAGLLHTSDIGVSPESGILTSILDPAVSPPGIRQGINQ